MCFNLDVFALDGLLYVLSGHDGPNFGEFDDFKRSISVEIYDPSTNTWSLEKISAKTTDTVGGVIIDKSLVTKFHS